MKLAFIINSLNSLRHLAPIIRGGLCKGYDIECWQNYSIDKNGSKGYLFPDIERLPFRTKEYQNLTAIPFSSKAEMVQAMLARNDVDFFVSQYYAELEMEPKDAARFNGRWCTVMHVHDSFLEMERMKPEAIQRGIRKLFFPYAQHYFDLGMRYFDEMLPVGRSYFSDPLTSVHPIGCAMVEPELLHLDKAAVRTKYGLPAGKEILIYLPFAFDFHDARGYKATYAWQVAFSGMHIKRKAGKGFNSNALVYQPLFKRLPKQLEYLKKVMSDSAARELMLNRWNEPAVINAIRAFCDANNLHLVVKPRIKFPVSDEVYKKADLVIDDDESQYCPSKLQELFSVCRLAIGYTTTAVFECIYSDVPYLNLRYPEGLAYNPHRKFWNGHQDGDPFAFGGAVWHTPIPEFIKTFPTASIGSYRMDQQKRKEYMEAFTGLEDPSPADNFYAALEREIAS